MPCLRPGPKHANGYDTAEAIADEMHDGLGHCGDECTELCCIASQAVADRAVAERVGLEAMPRKPAAQEPGLRARHPQAVTNNDGFIGSAHGCHV